MDSSVVLTHDTVADAQPESCSLANLFGGEEGVKKLADSENGFLPAALTIRRTRGDNEACDAQEEVNVKSSGVPGRGSAGEPANCRLSAYLAVAGIAGPVLFWIIMLIAQWLYPGNIGWEVSVSTLVLGPSGWLQTVDFYFLTLFTAAFGVAVYLGIARSAAGRVGSMAIVAMGIIQTLMAVFPVDANPSGSDSLAYVIHKLAVMISAGSFPIGTLLLVGSLWSSKPWRAYAYLTAGAAAAVFCLDMLWVASLTVQPHLVDPWFGIYERILLSIPLAWMAIIATRLLYISRRR